MHGVSSSDYASYWTTGDPMLDCVSVKVSTQKLESKDCGTELPFACMQLPGSAGLTAFQFIDVHVSSLSQNFNYF